jgi:hypothetical protein
MKDPNHTGAETEIVTTLQQQQEQQYHYTGSANLHPGQKLWRFRMSTGELEQVLLEKDKTFNMATKDSSQPSKVMADSDCLFVPAINRDVAMKKVLKMFGWKWDKKLKTGIPMFEEIKEEPKIIELNKPPMEKLDNPDPGNKEIQPGLYIVKEDDDPDAESDNKEPFEDDGAYAEDDPD